MTSLQADNLLRRCIDLWPNSTNTIEQKQLFKQQLAKRVYDDALIGINTHRTESTAPSPEFASILKITDKQRNSRADAMRAKFGNRLIDSRKRAMTAAGINIADMSDIEFSVRHARSQFKTSVLPLLNHQQEQRRKAAHEAKTIATESGTLTLSHAGIKAVNGLPGEVATRRLDLIIVDHRGMMAEAGISAATIEQALSLITITDDAEFKQELSELLEASGEAGFFPTV